MNTWDALRSRRNVRQYTDDPIAPVDLDRILEAGRRTPSANNRQWWDFVVCTDPRQLSELTGVWQGARHLAGAAAAVAVIVEDIDDPQTRETMQYDLGQLTMSMMVMAADLGIGSGHSAVRDQELARRILGLPNDRVCAWLIGFGYPVDRPLAPIANLNRRPFDEVVHRDRW
ncbi:MAG: nitroreductase family protein [Acidimicrobiia bacterium]|nr:nitroreductase family protein [Acidimicrobiia bacterium]